MLFVNKPIILSPSFKLIENQNQFNFEIPCYFSILFSPLPHNYLPPGCKIFLLFKKPLNRGAKEKLNHRANKIDPLSWMSSFSTYGERKYSRTKKEFLVDRIFALFEFNSSQKIAHNCTCVQ